MNTNNATKPPRKAPAPKRRMARPAAGKKVPTEAAPEPAAAHRETKKAMVIEMLQRPEGATLAQIMEATGWLKHTSSAFLTIQRGNGKPIESEKPVGGERVYRLKP